MIEQDPPASPAATVDIRLRPNRSATARGLKAFFGVMATSSLAVAGYSASLGNVFAPLFAVLELSALAACLLLVWRRLACEQRIALSPEAVIVSGAGGGARFDPYWVRVVRLPGRTPQDAERVALRSHGRVIEVGAFLGAEERRALARRLDEALAILRAARDPNSKDR